MSGVDLDGRLLRKGAADAVERFVRERGGAIPPEVRAAVDEVARRGGTPLVVAEGKRVLGVIQLSDVVKTRHPRPLRRAARAWASAP